MVTFLDGMSQREMFNKTEGPMEGQDQKYLAKISGVGKNGVILDKDAYTTKEFADKYLAARDAAWAKSDQKQ